VQGVEERDFKTIDIAQYILTHLVLRDGDIADDMVPAGNLVEDYGVEQD